MKVKKIKSNNYLFNIFIILLLIIIVICIYLFTHKSNTKNTINKIEKINTKNKKSIEIVVSRYNEDLKWTLKYPFNKYKYIVYNKGDDENYEKTNVLKSYNIKNQGKCDHTYFYHIVHNYDNLSEIVIFLPGCLDIYFKYNKAKLLIESIEKHNEAFFIVEYESSTSLLNEFYYYQMEEYKSMSQSNLEKDGNIGLTKSKIRPYGKWYRQNFDFDIQNITLFGIFSFNKKDIYNHDKSYYFKHMRSLEGAINHEVGHYYEKSWEAIFYPINHTYFLNYSNSVTDISVKFMIEYLKYYKEKSGFDFSNTYITGPLYWNLIYFINKYTYLKYNISKRKE